MPMITTELVASFLQYHFAPDISNVALIGTGIFSQAFSFNLNREIVLTIQAGD